MAVLATADRCALLARSRRVAVVGASADPGRPSNRIFAFLRELPQIEAVPINPEIAAIDGVRAYPTLAAYAAEHGAPDIVNVFRKPSEAEQVTRQAIAAGAPAIWFQLGVASEEAVRLADEAGLAVAAGCCIKVEWKRCAEESDSVRRGTVRLTARRPVRGPSDTSGT